MMKAVTFKAPEEDYDRWKQEAWAERITFGEWARRRLNGPTAPILAAVAKTKDKSCVHRLPKGSWCKRCEAIKK